MNLIWKLKKNNKANSYFNFILIMFIVIYIISFSIDFIKISWQRIAVSRHMAFICGVTARQGGFNSSKPSDWHSKKPYITRGEMITIVDDLMKKYKVESWSLTIGGKTLYMNSDVFKYGEDIPIELSIQYKWDLLDQLFFKDFSNSKKVLNNKASPHTLYNSPMWRDPQLKTYTVKRLVVSERYIRYDQYQE